MSESRLIVCWRYGYVFDDVLDLFLCLIWCLVVRMLRREYLVCLTRIEAEHFGFVCAVLCYLRCGFFAFGTSLVAVALIVFSFENLYGGAAAVPSVRRVEAMLA